MYFYCLGIRLDSNYQEVVCKVRDKCPYYTNTNLSVAMSRPTEYTELDTYNMNQCKYESLCKKEEDCGHQEDTSLLALMTKKRNQ